MEDDLSATLTGADKPVALGCVVPDDLAVHGGDVSWQAERKSREMRIGSPVFPTAPVIAPLPDTGPKIPKTLALGRVMTMIATP
jgi:hypothetical protein